MKSKSFYISLSAELHEKREAALAEVAAIEREINENIRLVNMAPDEDAALAEVTTVEAKKKKA